MIRPFTVKGKTAIALVMVLVGLVSAWFTPQVMSEASVLTISCTAKEARVHDLIIIFGFIRIDDYLPTGVPVQILIRSEVSNWTKLYETTTKNGGYYVEGNVSQRGEYHIRSIITNPYVTSEELPLTIGEKYVPASNTDTMDYPTFDDEYKFSFATVLSPEGTVLKRPPFTSTNTWLFFSFGQTPDKKHSLLLIGGFYAGTTEGDCGSFHLVLDEGAEQVFSFKSPLYFTLHPPLPAPDLPTLHSNIDGDYVCFQSYDEQNVVYYVNIATKTGSALEMTVTPRGTPFWIARKLNNLLWMDFIPNNPSGTEYWGGIVVLGDFIATVKTPGSSEELTYVGSCAIDREWHGMVDNSPYLHPRTDLAQSYTAGPYVLDQEISVVTWKAYDPFRKQILSQSGIIHIGSLGQTFRFDNFTITDDAPNALYPAKYFLSGQFSASGRVELEAKVIRFMYEFGNGVNEVFLRPIVLWNGTVTLPNGTSVPVINASGIGEEYRIQISTGDDETPPPTGTPSPSPIPSPFSPSPSLSPSPSPSSSQQPIPTQEPTLPPPTEIIYPVAVAIGTAVIVGVTLLLRRRRRALNKKCKNNST